VTELHSIAQQIRDKIREMRELEERIMQELRRAAEEAKS
jgi:hypothetical protein